MDIFIVVFILFIFGAPILILIGLTIKDEIRDGKRYYFIIKRKCTDLENRLIKNRIWILNAKSDKILRENIIKPEVDISLWNAVYEDRKLFEPSSIDQILAHDNSIEPDAYCQGEYEIVKEYAVRRCTKKSYLYNLKYQLEASGYEVIIEKKNYYTQ